MMEAVEDIMVFVGHGRVHSIVIMDAIIPVW